MAVTAPEVMRARPANFHFVLAVIFAAVAFGGFFPTYLYPIATTGVHASTVVHLHGLLFFGWTLLFVVQSRLAVTSIATHRSVGLLGISLATGMMFAALAVISGGLNEAVARGTETSARALATAPVFAIATFAVALVLALAYRRRSEYHKRFMVLATVALLPPAFARMLIVTIGGGGFGTRPALANARPAARGVRRRWNRVLRAAGRAAAGRGDAGLAQHHGRADRADALAPERVSAQRVEQRAERLIGASHDDGRGFDRALRFECIDERLVELGRLGVASGGRRDLVRRVVQLAQVRLDAAERGPQDGIDLVHDDRDGRSARNFSRAGHKCQRRMLVMCKAREASRLHGYPRSISRDDASCAGSAYGPTRISTSPGSNTGRRSKPRKRSSAAGSFSRAVPVSPGFSTTFVTPFSSSVGRATLATRSRTNRNTVSSAARAPAFVTSTETSITSSTRALAGLTRRFV